MRFDLAPRRVHISLLRFVQSAKRIGKWRFKVLNVFNEVLLGAFWCVMIIL